MKSHRKTSYEEKFAHLIGGEDDKGVTHKLHKDPAKANQMRKQHLFWVKRVDRPNMAGSSVLGDAVKSYIDEDRYDIEYLGVHRNWKTNKKLMKKIQEQVDDQIEGRRKAEEREGIFREDSYYEKLAAARKEEIQKQFEKE